jgi:hypothetical protein
MIRCDRSFSAITAHELVFDAKTQRLVCPMGICYRLYVSYLSGPLPEGRKLQPMRSYIVEFENGRLKILG